MEFLTQNAFGRVLADYVGIYLLYYTLESFWNKQSVPVALGGPAAIVGVANYFIHGTSIGASAMNAVIALAVYMYIYPGVLRGKWF
jgi:hypothetical protein